MKTNSMIINKEQSNPLMLLCSALFSDMQFVTNFTRIKFQNNLLPKKRVNYDKLRFPTIQRNFIFTY